MIANIFNGFCMALADSVPGVSGGTIAFILGFYDKFISSISDIFYGSKQEKIKAIKFLAVLGIGWVCGMGISVLLLSAFFTKEIYKISSLFIGFIAASFPIIIKEEKKTLSGNYKSILHLFMGAAAVIFLSSLKLSSTLTSNSPILGFLICIVAGSVAITTMVLPGISGSTMLMCFGIYLPLINAVKDLITFNFSGLKIIIGVGLGILIGVLLFIRLIKKLLESHRGACVYSVIDMMLGSFYAIVIGPKQLKTPQHAMNFSDFSIVFFLIGIAIMVAFTIIKSREEKAKTDSIDINIQSLP